jgi:hypothetical protein
MTANEKRQGTAYEATMTQAEKVAADSTYVTKQEDRRALLIAYSNLAVAEAIDKAVVNLGRRF